MKSLLIHRRCYGYCSRSLIVGTTFAHMYSTTKDTSDTLHEIGEKARSTAEEFTRKAKEKKESVKESGQEILEVAKDSALSDTQADKEKFKERVEKGNYDQIRHE